jgi:polar amino acid transport system substrate-binding protein
VNIAVFADYPPYSYVNSAGQITGIEIHMADAVAQQMGVKPVFHNVGFTTLFTGVQDHRYDWALGADVETVSREKVLDMMPWVDTDLVLVVKKGNPYHVNPNDLCNSSVIFGDTVASVNIEVDQEIAADCAKMGKPKPQVLTFQDVPTRDQALVDGHVTAYTDDPAVDKYEEGQGVPLQTYPIPASLNLPSAKPLPAGWAFQKGDKALETAVTQAIGNLIKNGTWQSIMKNGGIVTPIIPPSFTMQPVAG